MGGLCSKSSTHTGGHTVVPPQTLGGTPGAGRRITPSTRAGAPAPRTTASTGNRLDTSTLASSAHADGSRTDPRTAAAEAAERRQKEAQSRGTHAGNPNQGRLAGQLAANKAAKPVPETRQEEQRLVWD